MHEANIITQNLFHSLVHSSNLNLADGKGECISGIVWLWYLFEV